MAYELPENLDALSAEELQAVVDAGLEAFHALAIGLDSDEATLAEGERIAPLIAQADKLKRTREDETRSRRARATALIDAVTPPPVTTLPVTDPAPIDAVPTPAPADEAVPVETVVPDEVITPLNDPVAVAAGSPVRRAAANATPPVAPRPSMAVALTAAADVPGIPTGAVLDDMDALTSAVMARMKGIPTTNVGVAQHRYGAAMIRKQGYGELTQDEHHRDDYGLVWEAGNERRLPGGSLTAAGGWCAPSTTLYDMCQFETAEGMLTLPEIQVTRGGIRWTPGPDFADIYTDCGFFQTEAQAIAGTQKTCCIVDCPAFDEIRLDLIGLCVKTPLLTNAAYPELTRRFLEGALVAHQHKVNAYLINAMIAAAGTPVTTQDAGSISITMEGLEMVALGMRYQYRMSDATTIEVVAPYWLKALIRADLCMRLGQGPVSDAYIDGWFRDRGMTVQWVFDYQNLAVADCVVTIPNSVNILMFPAGTWVKGTAPVINVDAVYDSSGLECNVFTALFMEEGILAVQRCTHTCAVTLPVCVSGRTAAQDITDCLQFPGDTTAPAVAA